MGVLIVSVLHGSIFLVTCTSDNDQNLSTLSCCMSPEFLLSASLLFTSNCAIINSFIHRIMVNNMIIPGKLTTFHYGQ